jgi:hypothetical protein
MTKWNNEGVEYNIFTIILIPIIRDIVPFNLASNPHPHHQGFHTLYFLQKHAKALALSFEIKYSCKRIRKSCLSLFMKKSMFFIRSEKNKYFFS